MVRSSGYGGDLVRSSGEAISDISGKLAIGCSTVETFEESEDTWVCGLRRVKGWNRFNDNVVVPDDLPAVVQLLRCSIICRGSIGKGTGLHPFRIQDNGECGVGINVTTIGRELKLAGGHVVDAGDITHRCRITRASLNLLAVREGFAHTHVDEVVGADEGVRFTRGLAGTIDILNDSGFQSKGGLRIPPTVVVVTAVLVVSGGGVVIVAVVVGAVVLVIITTFHTVTALLAAAELVVLANHEAM